MHRSCALHERLQESANRASVKTLTLEKDLSIAMADIRHVTQEILRVKEEFSAEMTMIVTRLESILHQAKKNGRNGKTC